MSRWWAPDKGSLVPTQADRSLLVAGPDPDKDQGLFLLAAHRMGAAACEYASGVPGLSDRGLVEYLSAARTVFAPPLVDAIAKSAGPSADAEVAAILDDAEYGALSVFRACCASGVPANLAAQRAGMTYGVPQTAVGEFIAVAKDLRAHPAVLTATADRILMDHLCGIRLTGVVSKAVATLDNPSTTYYDGRDTDGQFAAATGTVDAELDDLLESLSPSKLVRVARKAKKARKARVARVTQQKPSTERVSTRVDARTSTQRAAVRDLVRQASARAVRSEPKPELEDGSLMAPINTNGGYQTVVAQADLVIPLDQTDYDQFADGLISTEDYFRSGNLQIQNITGVQWQENPETVRAYVEEMHDNGGDAFEPAFGSFSAMEYDMAESQGALDEFLEEKVRVGVEQWAHQRNFYDSDVPLDAMVQAGVANAKTARRAGNLGYESGQEQVSWWAASGAELFRHVTMLVIPEGSDLSGRSVEATRSGESGMVVDPNQTLRVAYHDDMPQWNSELRAMVTKIQLSVAHESDALAPDFDDDPWIEKAVATLDRSDTTYYDGRDTQGRFAAATSEVSTGELAGLLEEAPRIARPRLARKARTARKPLVTRTESRVEARVSARQGVRLQGLTAEVQRQAAKALSGGVKVPPKKDAYVLNEDADHTVASYFPGDGYVVVGDVEIDLPTNPKSPVVLDKEKFQALREHAVWGENTPAAIQGATTPDSFAGSWSPSAKSSGIVLLPSAYRQDDRGNYKIDTAALGLQSTALGYALEQTWQDNPGAQVVMMELTEVAGEQVEVKFSVRLGKPEQIVVVEHDEDIYAYDNTDYDPDNPPTFTYVGSAPLSEYNVQYQLGSIFRVASVGEEALRSDPGYDAEAGSATTNRVDLGDSSVSVTRQTHLFANPVVVKYKLTNGES